MLTAFDAELYPDDCGVVEILPHNQWVYLIQKNGSSSLRRESEKKGYSIYRCQEIKNLPAVDVYIRDPKSRYISGVNTFVQHLTRDNPGLDKNTCTWMATRYLFMNRHYLPQFHWVLNLSRFLSPSCQIRLHLFETIGNIIDTHDDAMIIKATDSEIDLILANDQNLDFWFFVDQLLRDHAGESLSWNELILIYKNHPSNVYDILTKKARNIFQSLNALP